MDKQTKIVIITLSDLQEIIEQSVQRVLDTRLPKTNPKYYSVRDVSKLLKCSTPYIYNLIKKGHLTSRKIPGSSKIRFIQEDIDNFFKVYPNYTTKRIRGQKIIESE
jgi:excisionase family DNA binding protein